MTTPLEYGFEKAAYSIRQAAAKLGIGRTKLYELIRSGDLRPIKPCKKNLILAIEMAALLDRWRAEPAKQHLVKRRKAAVMDAKAEAQRAKGRELTPESATLLAELGL